MRVRKEFISYCLVGVANTIVGLSTAYVFLNVFLSSYIISVAAAYVAGIIVSFFLNKKYTFNNNSNNNLQLFVRFVFAMLPSYIISYYFGYHVIQIIVDANIFNHILINLSKFTGSEIARLTDNMAVLMSMAIYLVLGFSVNKLVIFKQKNKPQIE